MVDFSDASQESLILDYASAQAALERLDERRSLSPVRDAFRIRAIVAERQALARIDGAPLDEAEIEVDGRGQVTTSAYDLSHGRDAVDREIALNQLLHDSDALLEWLGVGTPRQPVQDLTLIRDRIERWQAQARALPPSPPLLHAARLALRWRDHKPVGRGDRVISLLIGDRWSAGRWKGSAGGLVAMGLDHGQSPWQRARDEVHDRIWLHALRDGARLHLDLEQRLRAYALRAQHVIEGRRRPGRLGDVIQLAIALPRISSGVVARRLGLTAAGAIKLLTIATDLGLLVERTGQASYRHYAIPVAPSTARPLRSPATIEIMDDRSDASNV